MSTKNIIVGIALIISLLGLPTKVIAEPLEIKNQTDIKVYSFEKVLNTWNSSQWDYFDKLIERESHWNNTAQNKSSTAYGLGQFLNSTWSTVGCKKTDNQYKQIDCTIDYIITRYDSPKNAILFHNKNGWY